MHPNWVTLPSIPNRQHFGPSRKRKKAPVLQAPREKLFLTDLRSPDLQDRSLTPTPGFKWQHLLRAPIPQMGQSEPGSSCRVLPRLRMGGSRTDTPVHPGPARRPRPNNRAPLGLRGRCSARWAPSPTCDHCWRSLAPLRSQPHLQRERVPGQLEVGPQAQLLASPAEIERPARRARLLGGAPRLPLLPPPGDAHGFPGTARRRRRRRGAAATGRPGGAGGRAGSGARGAAGPRVSPGPAGALGQPAAQRGAQQPQAQHPTPEPHVRRSPPPPLRPCTAARSCQLWETRRLDFLRFFTLLGRAPPFTCFFLFFLAFLLKVCAPLPPPLKNTAQLLLVGN